MVVDVSLYTVVHQPRRLKLPAQPIPRCASIEDITHCLFDERLNEHYFHQVAQSCYYPAVRMFLALVRQQGLHLALGISLSFVRQATLWDPALLDLFRELVAEERVEIIGIEPYQSLHCLIDLPAFVARMGWMADEVERTFGKRPTVVDTIEMGMSSSIYHALDSAGFRGALMENCPQVMQWRSSGYLYRSGLEGACAVPIKAAPRPRRGSAKIPERDRQGPPYATKHPSEQSPYLLTRHAGLSADVGERFSNRAWPCYPLYAGAYADWIGRAEGDFALLGWDLETLGVRHAQSSGIFEFLQALPDELARRGIATRTPSELIERFASEHTYNLPLPIHPATWAASSNVDACFDHGSQRTLFQLMNDVYNLARLTENPELFDLAIWLTQADNLHLMHWPGPQIAASVAPYEWSRLSPSGLMNERKQVYLNVLYALEPYLPAHTFRQTPRKSVRAPKSAVVATELRERATPEADKKPRASKAAKTTKSSKGASRTARRRSISQT
jgi:alpha-amylase